MTKKERRPVLLFLLAAILVLAVCPAFHTEGAARDREVLIIDL